MRKLDITGMKFGKLTALKQSVATKSQSKSCTWWDCLCDCGNVFNTRLTSLRAGRAISCGCIKRNATHRITHNLSKRPEYNVWISIKNRCLNVNCADFSFYGGRGITICDEWKHSFESFIKDMGFKPEKNMSIDRIDNDGNYEPSNCRWTDKRTQSRNRRDNKFYEFNGMKMCQTDWAEYLGISGPTLITRLRKWPLEKSLSTFKGK